MSSRTLFDSQNLERLAEDADTTQYSELFTSAFWAQTNDPSPVIKADRVPDNNEQYLYMWGSRIATVSWSPTNAVWLIVAGPLLQPTLPVFPAAVPPTKLDRPIIHMDFDFSISSTRAAGALDYIEFGFLERNILGQNLNAMPIIVSVKVKADANNTGRLDRFFVTDAASSGHLLLMGGPAQGAPSTLLIDTASDVARGRRWVNRASLVFQPPQIIYQNPGGTAQTYNGELLGFVFNGLSAGGWKAGTYTEAWVNEAAEGFLPDNPISILPPTNESNPYTNLVPYFRYAYQGSGSGSDMLIIHRMRVWENLPTTESVADADVPQAVILSGYGEGLAAQDVHVVNTQDDPVPIEDVSATPSIPRPPDA